MIEIKQVKTQDEVNYTFVEKLMHTAFPQEERRDTVQIGRASCRERV